MPVPDLQDAVELCAIEPGAKLSDGSVWVWGIVNGRLFAEPGPDPLMNVHPVRITRQEMLALGGPLALQLWLPRYLDERRSIIIGP